MQQGFIFDLDGVLTDTAEYHYRGWAKLAREEMWHFTHEDNERLRGISRLRSLDILLEINGITLSEVRRNELATRKNNYYLEFIREITPKDLLRGASDLLHEAKSKGIRLGLGSASKNAREVCQRLGILDLFDAIGDGYTVVRGKPAPDLFVWVAGRLGLGTRQCIVFEDAESGVEAALAGKLWVVGIGSRKRLSKAHRVRPNLVGATVAEFELPLSEVSGFEAGPLLYEEEL